MRDEWISAAFLNMCEPHLVYVGFEVLTAVVMKNTIF
jgi:hypothetical protein